MSDTAQHFLIRSSYGCWNVMRGRQLLAGRRDLFDALTLLWYFMRLHRGATTAPMPAQPGADR